MSVRRKYNIMVTGNRVISGYTQLIKRVSLKTGDNR